MPHRRLAGLLLMLTMLQIALAPAAYACMSHHATAAQCHDAAAGSGSGSESGGAPGVVGSLAWAAGHQSHDSHHTQACCAAGGACRGVLFPASAAALGAPVARAPLTPAQASAPAVRRAAPDSPPPKI
jgi:hypothetical protein